MARAVRVVTVERGVDPRDLALVAFGGAGPLHAAAIAAELGIRRVIVARHSGVLSAIGLIASERRRDLAESVLLSAAEITDRPGRGGRRAPRRARAWRARRAERARERELRPPLRGPGVRAERPGEPGPDPAALRAAFDEAHDERYGYSRSGRRARARHRPRRRRRGSRPSSPKRSVEPGAQPRARRASFDGEWLETTVVDGIGESLAGPAIVEPARGDARRPARMDVPPRRRRDHDGARRVSVDPVTLQVMLGALRAGCEEMGAVLVRSAHSANIKERRDASTALFDPNARDGDAGRAHPRPPRGDAGGGRRDRRRATAPGRRLDRQRPLSRRHSPAGHHRGLTGLRRRGADRLRREPRAPRRRRRVDPRAACPPTRARSRRRAS